MTITNSTYNVINPSHSPEYHHPQSGITSGFDVGEYSPYIRYARTGDDGSPRQIHRLHHIDEPVPVDVDFASPVYLLDDDQVERHERLKGEKDRFRVSDHTSIAIALQNESEEERRVRYPLFIESDAETEFFKMRSEMMRFIREVLDVDPHDGKWYFSGNRSLHVHLPYYVEDETDLRWLRRKAKAFNETSEAPIDPSNYSRKNLFRLPYAVHHKKNRKKLPVASDSTDAELQAEIARAVAGRREAEQSPPRSRLDDFYQFSVSQRLELGRNIPVPLKEQRERPTGGADLVTWKRYNRHPFSPYANTGNERRSVLVAQIKGSPYCRDTEAEGKIDSGIFVPAYIYSAVCPNSDYTIFEEDGRFRLSETDYKKWDYNNGDIIVLLGGQSKSSRIFELKDPIDRELVVDLLYLCHRDMDPEKNRRGAIELLDSFGYEVGSAGKNGPYRQRSRNNGVNQNGSSSRSYRLQKQAEQYGIDTLSHDDRLHVANRLLKQRGWDGADQWFRDQFGENYDQEITHRYLRSVAEKYDDLPTPPS